MTARLLCRLIGHRWRYAIVSDDRYRSWRQKECRRCGEARKMNRRGGF
jgi:hypothetical protein